MKRKAHWDHVYRRRETDTVSWYEARPEKSLAMIRASGVQAQEPIIDVGGGASFLVDVLLDLGYRDLTVLDLSSHVLQILRSRLGPRADAVTLLEEDVLTFRPARQYALWHDRAVFHFLVHAAERARYREVLHQALRLNGHLILATFGPQGPERCSGLPVRRYDAARLAVELGDEFALKESLLEMHVTPSGGTQQFLYSRFQYKSQSPSAS